MSHSLEHQDDNAVSLPTGGDEATQTLDTSDAFPHVVLPSDYHFQQIDRKYTSAPKLKADEKEADLGVLSGFQGVWHGIGLNQIFRPNSGATPTKLPIPVTPAPPEPPNDAILELNLIRETLSFSEPLGDIPNRGFGGQGDIFLNGRTYLQSVDDVANPETGDYDGQPVNIHIENGMWMHVPKTDVEPKLDASVARMGTIPHGTTINAQGIQLSNTLSGPPPIAAAPITPFIIGQPTNLVSFPSQTATANDTARLPQDLSKFIAAGTITQEILDDVNVVLRDAIKDQKITETTTIIISTTPNIPVDDDGTSNIAFLTGTKPTATAAATPNANALHMEAIFWIETVEYEIEVPSWKPGQKPLHIKPKQPSKFTPVPCFEVKPPHKITKPQNIKVETKQIQYTQLVNLDFGPLTWPHRSVATLVPKAPVLVPDSAFKADGN
ncbi:hypothetical protein NLU13_8944 [Sarocladium strictum]|uniref:Uncharacterized protein n=1 Tax=Sarocladium strictum TaxID=5046 RepID=A0AA39L3Q7_SARSR|nr:hypothetical protein NLU13_8944 [Sarocladium strictum]